MKKKITLSVIMLFFGQLVLTFPAYAVGSSGFEVGTNSARSLGRGNAVVADPQEATAVVFNPAGLTSLDGNQVTSSLSIITVHTDYSGVNGGLSEDVNHPVGYAPAVFLSFSTPIKNFKLGAGVNSPFGLETQWSSVGNFKYTANYNQIKTVAYNLSAAYQVADWLSIGGGLTYLDAYTKQVGKVSNAFAGPFSDSNFEVDVNGDGYGMNLGAQIKPFTKHTIGFFYRTQIRTKQTGEIDIDSIPSGLESFYSATSSSFNTRADTDITFPGSFTAGYNYQINDKWDVESDFTWTQWSSFDRVDFAFDTPSLVLSGLEPVSEGFKNVFSLNIGSTYKLNPSWSVSGGYFFYDMATGKPFYSNAIPDGDRHAFTFGLGHTCGSYTLDLSYVGEYFSKVSIDNAVGNISGESVDGDYTSWVNIITVSVTKRF